MFATTHSSQYPAIFNTAGPAPGASKQYRFIPTIELIDALTKEGFEVVNASQGAAVGPYARHRVMLSHRDFKPFEIRPGDTVRMRIALFNGHNRRTGFAIHAGAFRDVCSNGMIFGNIHTNSVTTRHIGSGDVIEGVYRIIEDSQNALEDIRNMADTSFSVDRQREFASRAIELRWPKQVSPVQVDDVLRARREKDVGDNLFLTYQRVQESLVQGGMPSYTRSNKLRSIRALKSVTTDLRVNNGLFQLATEYLNAA